MHSRNPSQKHKFNHNRHPSVCQYTNTLYVDLKRVNGVVAFTITNVGEEANVVPTARDNNLDSYFLRRPRVRTPIRP